MLSGATLDRFRPNPPLGRKEKAQGLKPRFCWTSTARLKSCPDTKHQTVARGGPAKPRKTLRSEESHTSEAEALIRLAHGGTAEAVSFVDSFSVTCKVVP
jgi:hypothetical protein